MGKFPSDDPQVVVIQRCPALKDYASDKTVKAGKEMQALRKATPDAASPELIRDYGTLRNQCRAIEAVPVPSIK